MGGNVAKNPVTGKKKKIKHASNMYRKGGYISSSRQSSFSKKYPGMGE